MKIHQLAEQITEEDKIKMLELYKTKYISASQNALFLLWMKYTGVREKTSCSKCRSRLMTQISKFLTIVRNETQNAK
jgi:hypothetical protein